MRRGRSVGSTRRGCSCGSARMRPRTDAARVCFLGVRAHATVRRPWPGAPSLLPWTISMYTMADANTNDAGTNDDEQATESIPPEEANTSPTRPKESIGAPPTSQPNQPACEGASQPNQPTCEGSSSQATGQYNLIPFEGPIFMNNEQGIGVYHDIEGGPRIRPQKLFPLRKSTH